MTSPYGLTLSTDQVILVSLMIKIGFMAAFATVLSRFDTFKRMFIQEREGVLGRFYFTVLIGGIFVVGLGARIILGYGAMDMTREGSMLAGLIAGPLVGMIVGTIVGLPSLGVAEFAALPMCVVYGLAGGLMHRLLYRRRARISFSPLSLIFIKKRRERWVAKRALNSDVILFWSIIVLQLITLLAGVSLGKERLYILVPNHWGTLVATLIGAATVIGVPLMIWDHTYLEMELKERSQRLVQARLDALKSRIRPHFLFNTLNTIAAMIRIDPPKARNVVLKLSEILRTILETKEELRPLEKEIALIDDFLDIERARFGADSIRVIKKIDPSLNQVPVPSLFIQPIVENSVIHGLRKKTGSGTILISIQRNKQRIEIVVEDDGAGISKERMGEIKTASIGLSNVEERLRVLYGRDYNFDIKSKPGRGTRTLISLPFEVQTLDIAANE